MFKKILIANRGEIALRIIRACQEMGIRTVAIHSAPDQHSMHVKLADECVCIGPAAAKDSYLKIQAILAAAEVTGADAIHPGYGFLSENAHFAQVVNEHNMVFIGPKPEHIDIMGNKVTAKQMIKSLGIPVVPGSDGAITSVDEAKTVAKAIGFPVLIKASSGGGGKGMQVASTEEELEEKLSLCRSEAAANFGDDSVFIEKYLITPRHIEVQVLGDGYGNVIHLGERDCSIQRRHQKVWEEAPSPVITVQEREEIGSIVTKGLSQIGYQGAGTVEFLYENGQFYFIEMNTRIQVEHPVTEMISGIDLIKEQIRVAYGEKLGYTQKDITIKGHAIECRINAEDPYTFIPSPGTIQYYHPPGGLNVRVESALHGGASVLPYYDSLVSKLIVYAPTREECLKKLEHALNEYVITGVSTTLPLHKALVCNDNMKNGEYHIHWLEDFLEQ